MYKVFLISLLTTVLDPDVGLSLFAEDFEREVSHIQVRCWVVKLMSYETPGIEDAINLVRKMGDYQSERTYVLWGFMATLSEFVSGAPLLRSCGQIFIATHRHPRHFQTSRESPYSARYID